MSLGLRLFAPVGCDTDGIAGKAPDPKIGCDLPKDGGIAGKAPEPKVGCDLPKDGGIAGESSDKVQKALETLAAIRLFQPSYSPMAPHNAYSAPDFGYGPGVMPGSTGIWTVPPMTDPCFPGGIML